MAKKFYLVLTLRFLKFQYKLFNQNKMVRDIGIVVYSSTELRKTVFPC